MAAHPFGFQLDWNAIKLSQRWLEGPDLEHFVRRQMELTVDTVLAGGASRVLDVAAATATHTAEIAARGVAAVALDPSQTMLDEASASMATRGVSFARVRGVAETLPFRDGSFDRVLCHSAIDHVADPDLAVREMTRLLTNDGRLVLSAVNYGGVGARCSRWVYRAARRLSLLEDERVAHQFWDSPVPVEQKTVNRSEDPIGSPSANLQRSNARCPHGVFGFAEEAHLHAAGCRRRPPANCNAVPSTLTAGGRGCRRAACGRRSPATARRRRVLQPMRAGRLIPVAGAESAAPGTPTTRLSQAATPRQPT